MHLLGVGILLEDVGGMYVNNCHILGHAIGISAGCTQPHAFNEVWVTGNRIGLQEAACIVLQRLSGSGFYAQANISDNYLGSPEATFVTCVQLGAPGGVGDIAFTSVSDNRLTAGGASVTTLLAINSGSDVYVDSNDFVSANPANVAIGLPSASYSDVRIGRNKYTNFTAHQTITGPPVLGVVFEPDLKVLTTVVNPPSIASGISLSIPVNVPGVRPSHGDSVLLQRPASLSLGLALIGQGVTSNDLAFVVLHNTTGGLIDDGPSTWTYTWIDMVP